jgi:hypothetical protein
VLQAAGFHTTEKEFEYSAAGGAFAMPIAGAVSILAALLLYLARYAPWLIAIAMTLLALTIGALAWVGADGVLTFPLMRRRGVNLEAVREGERPGVPAGVQAGVQAGIQAGDEPAVWLVAHLDSKWQPISMIARVAGVVGTSVGVVVLFLLSLAPTHDGTAATFVLALTWLVSAPLLLSVVGARNTGAVDNASGVSAVLAAAEQLPRSARVGVLITDAEELALAGARAWARTRRPGVALNCDSIDDHGRLTLMYSRGRPERLISLFVRVSSAQGEPARVMRLIPGVLTDSVALADAGWETLTLSRGDLRTLQRIHTASDTLRAMRGTALDAAARVLAQTATELG